MADMALVLNTIYQNASQEFVSRVPEPTIANIAQFGEAVMDNKATENEFLDALVNKVAMQLVHNKTFHNPLAVLKKRSVPLGRNIEEIYTNPATSTVFDPTGKDLLSRSLPDTKTIYHRMNRQDKYKVSISKAQLMGAFRSYDALEELVNSIVASIYSGDNYDEFNLMKTLLVTAAEGNMVKVIHDMYAPDNEASAKEFVKTIKTFSELLTFPSSQFCGYNMLSTPAKPVITWTPKEKQVLILRADVAVNTDVELLAKAFNVSYAEMSARTITIDSFGVSKYLGMLCDEAAIQVYDNLKQMESFHNGEGLYESYIYHHWQTYSLSLFANAIAFSTDAASSD